MKKITGFNYWHKAIYFIAIIMLFGSCNKEEPMITTVDDVFDFSGLDLLNQNIESAATIGDLSAIYENESLEVSEAWKEISVDEIIDHFTISLKLSSQEIDLLLKNDSRTYLDVLNRFGSFPPKMDESIFSELKSGSIGSKYILIQKTEFGNFYGGNYYLAVLAYQDFMNNRILKPLKKLNSFESNILKSAVGVMAPPEPGPNDTVTEIFNIKQISKNWYTWKAKWTNNAVTDHSGSTVYVIP